MQSTRQSRQHCSIAQCIETSAASMVEFTGQRGFEGQAPPQIRHQPHRTCAAYTRAVRLVLAARSKSAANGQLTSPPSIHIFCWVRVRGLTAGDCSGFALAHALNFWAEGSKVPSGWRPVTTSRRSLATRAGALLDVGSAPWLLASATCRMPMRLVV